MYWSGPKHKKVKPPVQHILTLRTSKTWFMHLVTYQIRSQFYFFVNFQISMTSFISRLIRLQVLKDSKSNWIQICSNTYCQQSWLLQRSVFRIWLLFVLYVQIYRVSSFLKVPINTIFSKGKERIHVNK